jgi:ribosomal protein S18 acetylase RimI-like enzyme
MTIRPAIPADAAACVEIRGRTRENAVSAERLAEYGITVDSWREDIQSGALPGRVCLVDQEIAGYCFAIRKTGEIAVLALLPEHEGKGFGRELLGKMLRDLQALGFKRAFLGCSPDPASRSYGFYRHLGWKSTGAFDSHGDEVLELWLS